MSNLKKWIQYEAKNYPAMFGITLAGYAIIFGTIIYTILIRGRG